MGFWEVEGQLYERAVMYDLQRSGWFYEVQALRGQPGDGPTLHVFVPDDDPAAATITWEGSIRSVPLTVMRRFLDQIDEDESAAQR